MEAAARGKIPYLEAIIQAKADLEHQNRVSWSGDVKWVTLSLFWIQNLNSTLALTPIPNSLRMVTLF